MDREPSNGHNVTDLPRTPPPRVEAAHAPAGLGWLWTLLVLALLGGGGYYYYAHVYSKTAGDTQPSSAPVREVPVVTAIAKKGDMQLFARPFTG